MSKAMGASTGLRDRQPASMATWLPFLLLLAALLVVYRDTAGAMVAIWARSETFNHCFLIPPIALWLIWQKREWLDGMRATPAWWALLPLGLAGCGWLAGDLARVDVLTHFALVAMLVSLVPLVFGTAITRVIAFPLAFLFLTVPFGEFAMPWMMERTADFTVAAVAMSGIPVYREGLHFVIPSGNWSVIEACSGVRYLIASFTVGCLFAYLNYRSAAKRLVFVGVSIIVPIVANWLRAYLIVMLGHLSNNRIAVGVDHLIYGWVFFGVVIMIMFAIGARFGDEPAAAPAAFPDVPVAGPASGGSGYVLFVLALAILVAPVAFSVQVLTPPAAKQAPHLTLPGDAGEWRAERAPDDGWTPSFERSVAQARRRYVGPEADVDVYVAYYRRQADGGKMVGSESVLVRSDDNEWLRTSEGREELRLAGQAQAFRSAQLVSLARFGPRRGERLAVWYLYWVDGRLSARESEVKAWTAWSRLRGRGDDSAVLVLHTLAGPHARTRVQAFIDAAGPGLLETLARARGGP